MCKDVDGGMIHVFLLPAELYTFLGKITDTINLIHWQCGQ